MFYPFLARCYKFKVRNSMEIRQRTDIKAKLGKVPRKPEMIHLHPSASLLDDDDVGGDPVAVNSHRPRLGHAALAP